MSVAETERPDPRLNAYRTDLADARLEGRVSAARFVAGAPSRVATGTASLREAPVDEARQGSELLYGERVAVFERKRGWAWVRNETDGYVGYLREEALGPAESSAATHRVIALRSYLFDAPDLKTVPRATVHLTSRVTVTDHHGDWARVADDGWLWAMHLAPLQEVERDPVAVARRFMGAPYAWGGRSTTGLDCSALVQLALAACGVDCPRDSDMQEASLGEKVASLADARPGDLLYWPGHVAFLLESDRILHANGHHMAVAEELHDAFRARNMAKIGDVRTVRRVDRLTGA
ncbi:MAG: C40 family peptidase [Thalassobaculaceae bacterium]|nr:C40 family peptidase [Thalassobaculaceae bacterium]